MNNKLTLSLNREAIRKGKRFAKRNKKSLSGLVQDYFNSLGEKPGSEEADEKIQSPLTVQMVRAITKAKSGKNKPADHRHYSEILTGELKKKYKVSDKDLSRFKHSH